MMKENKAIPKKVKGTVLFTVVAVMMVLIVFLTATLALATTANKRAYTNYQQEQSEYTAKAVLSAVSKQIEADTDGSGIRKDVVALADNATATIPVTADDTSETYNVIVTNTGEKHSVYDTTTLAWKDIPVYSFSVTVDSNTTAASATYESYMAIDVVTTPGTSTPGTGSVSSGNGGAFVSLGDTAGTELATKGYTTGGTYIGIGIAPENYSMSSSGGNVIDAPYFVNGTLTVKTAFAIHFTKPGDFMVVKGDFIGDNNNSLSTSFAGYNATSTSYEDTPYIYIDGKFQVPKSKTTVGDATHAVNIYCGNIIEVDGSNGYAMYGDLYMMDEDVTSKIITGGASTDLYKWTGATLKRVDGKSSSAGTQYGNIYSMGSLEVSGNNGLNVNGDLQLKRDLIVNGNITVDGNIIVDGKITVASGATLKSVNGSVYAGTIENNGTINVASGKAVCAVNHSGNAPTGASFTDLTGLTPVTETKTTKKYYTNSATWIVDKGGNHYKIQAAYTEYNIDDKGNVTTSVHGDPVNNHEYWNRETLQEIDFTPSATYPTVEDYVMANNELYKNIKTAIDEASAIVTTYTGSYYNLDTYCTKTKEVYPSDYTRASLNRPNNGTIATPTLDQPTKVDYKTLYPTSIESLVSSGLFEVTSKNAAGDVTGGKYKIPTYIYNDSSSTATTKYDSTVKSCWAGGIAYDSSGNPTYQLKNGDKNNPGNGHYYVDHNCVLNGTFKNNIYIDGSKGPITVVLDNFTSDTTGDTTGNIIINDTNQVTLFIVGNTTIGQRDSIITEDYMNFIYGYGNWNLNSTIKDLGLDKSGVISNMSAEAKDASGNIIARTIPQEVELKPNNIPSTYPNVVINSDKDATLNTLNGSFVTALIRAPEMIFAANQSGTTNSHTILYELPNGEKVKYGKDDDFDLGTGDTCGTGFALIGQLIAKKIKITSDGDWGMLYVTDKSNNGKPGKTGLGGSTSGTTTPGTTTSTANLLFTNIY